ncbi:MAG: siderophore-interacting protein [Nocardioidaceae bacterium]
MAKSAVPMRVHRAEVVRVEELSPAMRRVVFGGEDLASYASTGVGDEYIRLLLPGPGQVEPPLPAVVDGDLDWSSIDLDLCRTYTVRAFDAGRGEITVDFVVHDGGVAAAWALRAQPGDRIVLNTPSSLYDPPADLAWQILVADYAGLPALARLLEQTPEHVGTRVVVEIADDAHRIQLPAHPRAEVTWMLGGNGHGPSRLEDVVRTLPRPGGVGYVWVAGEAKALRAVRKHLRHGLGLPATAYKTVGYWIENAEAHRAKYDALDPAVKDELESMWTSDRDEEEIEDEYDARLAQLGL